MSNPIVPKVLEAASNNLDYIHKVVVLKHLEEFEKMFMNAKRHMGDVNLEEGRHLFEKFVKG